MNGNNPPLPPRQPWHFVRSLFMVVGAITVLSTLLSLFFHHNSRYGAKTDGNIGLVTVEGTIEHSDEAIDALIRYRKDDHAKAILLRIDSPGGAIAPSQEIYREVLRTIKTKPVVVSMGSLAASGGYYIASAASKIVANPGTVTGSIGVIFQHFMVDDIARTLKLRWEIIKAGEVKDMASPLRALTDKERAILNSTIQEFHEQFIRDIAKGRHLGVEKVRALATGAIFSGEKAVTLKLVDQLGNQQDALELAGRLANLKEEATLIEEPDEHDFMDYLLKHAANSQTLQNLQLKWMDALTHRSLTPRAELQGGM